jgi:hypothetical protein
VAGFNKLKDQPPRVTPSGPLRTVSDQPDAVTFEGAPAYRSDAKSELFKRATTRFVGEAGFYETADENVTRLRELVRELAVDDETWPWVQVFLTWLRGPGNIRTGAILLAAEAVHARLERLHELNEGRDPKDVVRGDGHAELISAVLQRPDEPGELLAYWRHRWGVTQPNGTVRVKLPKPVKRGVADAVGRLYDEAAFLRYDTAAAAMRFGDVLELTHARGKSTGGALFPSPTEEVRDALPRTWQDDLFRWAITARQDRNAEPPETLSKVHLRHTLSRYTPDQRHELARSALDGNQVSRDLIQGAMVGQWEWLKPWLGERPTTVAAVTDAEIWQLALPSMGIMAQLRNLRNLDEAGVPDKVIAPVLTRFADPEQAKRSRQLPYRVWSAYREAPSLRWGHALEQFLNNTLQNVPVLDGQTLVLIDVSASMTMARMSGKSKMDVATAATIFGMALKVRNPAGVDAWGFATGQFEVTGAGPGMSLLRAVEAFRGKFGIIGGGTEMVRALNVALKPEHRQVIILTDMQTFGGPHMYHTGNVDQAVPRHVPIFAVNVAGYANTAMPVVPGNNRFELAGLGDSMFGLIPLLLAGEAGRWPWELAA